MIFFFFFNINIKKLHYEFRGRNDLQLFLFIDDNSIWIKIIIRIYIRIFSLPYRFDVYVDAFDIGTISLMLYKLIIVKKKITNQNRHNFNK